MARIASPSDGSARVGDYHVMYDLIEEALTAALEELAVVAAATGRIRGKKVKTIRGRPDSFHRLAQWV